MQVLEAKTHLNEEFPDGLLIDSLAHLLLEEEPKVSLFAPLHDDVDLSVRCERIVHLDDVGVLQPLHQHGFLG